jgi:hypothetical protein
VEYRRYLDLGHGFGPGVGTSAEGWIGDATRFWERFIRKSSASSAASSSSADGSGQVSLATTTRARYSLAVLGDSLQLRAIARPDKPSWSLSRMISRSLRMGSLSAAIATSPQEGGISGELPSYVTLQTAHRLLPGRSAIGMARNQ